MEWVTLLLVSVQEGAANVSLYTWPSHDDGPKFWQIKDSLKIISHYIRLLPTNTRNVIYVITFKSPKNKLKIQ